MTALEREYRLLIARAVRDGDLAKKQELEEHALLHFDLELRAPE